MTAYKFSLILFTTVFSTLFLEASGNHEFDTSISYEGNQFNERLIVQSREFMGATNFSYSTFDSLAYFGSSTFDSVALFWGVKFKSQVNFTYTNFKGATYFAGSEFDSLVSFRGTRFNAIADFSRATFMDEANFLGARFDSAAVFIGTRFRDARFYKSTLPESFDFRSCEVEGGISLLGTFLNDEMHTQNRKCRINLIGARIDKFNFTYDNFILEKPDTVLSKAHYQNLNSVYERLLKRFNYLGYKESYQALDKEYQEFKRTQNPYLESIYERYLGYFFNWLNKNWNDYGYAKDRIWRHTTMFLVIFIFLNWSIFSWLVLNVYSIPSIDKAMFRGERYTKMEYYSWPMWTKLLFNFKYAVYYTILIFFGLRMTIENINFRNWGVVIIFIEYVIGLICLGYLANFVISSDLIGA